MTPQELKSSILQLAVQGRLVEQRPEEGTAEELYRQIQEEKQRLIKEGKIKKEKPLPEITEDEVPFDIPESWKWVKLGNILSVYGGKRIPAGRKLTDTNTGHIYIRVSDMKNGTVATDNLLFVPNDLYDSISRYIIKTEDVYITVAGTIGRVGKIPPELDGANLTENADRLVFSNINQDWLIQTLDSPLIKMQIAEATTKVGQPKLAIKRIQELHIPLPPLAEQKRIVAKIEELLPYIDCYEKAWSKLEDFNKRFPGDMQKSVLQMAIQGKLVEQRPEEGTGEELYTQIQAEKQSLIKSGKIKKEKPLPEISEDEIPFDIPDSWKWVRIGSLLHKLVDGTHRTPKYTTSGVPFVSVKNMSNGVLSLENTKFISKSEHEELWKRCNPQRGDLLLSKVGTTGVPAKVDTDIEFSLFVSVALLKFNNQFIDIDFLIYSILAPDFQKQCKVHTRGVGNKNWVIKDIANTLMPLPPIAEQKRIVQKLEEILPLCDKLK